jgi:hypothetical protein
LMLGHSTPVQLPNRLTWMLEKLHTTAAATCGSVRMEWAFDGKDIWTLQLQQETAVSIGEVIVPGDLDNEVEFDVTQGLDALRQIVARLKGTKTGLKLIGRVGLTSHIADVLRRHNVPARMAP